VASGALTPYQEELANKARAREAARAINEQANVVGLPVKGQPNTINGIDHGKSVKLPAKAEAPSSAELKELMAGYDSTNKKGAFDKWVSKKVSDKVKKLAWNGGESASPNAPYKEAVTPFADPFDVNGEKANIGEPPNGLPLFGALDEGKNTPKMPRMEPLPYKYVKPEAPPALPTNLAAVGGDVSKCQGGKIVKAAAYYGCHTIEGYLAITNTDLENLDDFSSIEAIDFLPGFDNNGVGLIIKGNKRMKNIDGLSNLAGKIPGSVVVVDNKQLRNLGGLNGVTTINGASRVTGQSIIIAQNPALENVNGLSGVRGALPGSIAVLDNDKLANIVGFESIISAKADKNGLSIQVDNNGNLESMRGLNGLQSVEGGVRVSGNLVLSDLAMKSLTSIGCSKTKRSIEVSNNAALKTFNGLDSMAGSVCGSIDVQNNKNLVDLKGIEGITAVGSDNGGVALIVSMNSKLSDISALKTIEAIKGSLIVQGTSLTSTADIGVVTLGKDSEGRSLVLGNNKLMTDASLKQLKGAVPGSILVYDSPALANTHLLFDITSIGADKKGVSLAIKNTGIEGITGASSLTTVLGGIALTENHNLKKIDLGAADGITVGASNTDQNSIEIVNNGGLLHTDGLNVVGSLTGGVVIQGNNKLTSLSLPASNLGADKNGRCLSIDSNAALKKLKLGATKCAGGLAITNNELLTDVAGLNRLKTLGKGKNRNSLEVSGNSNLQSLKGLEGLTSATGGITIQNNPKLINTNLSSLRVAGKNGDGRCLEIVNNAKLSNLYTDSLQSCEGSITISKTCLKDMTDLSSLRKVGVDKMGKSFAFIANDCLKNLHGLGGVSNAPGGLEVADNKHLEHCDGMALKTIGKDKSGNSISIIGNKNLKSYECFGSEMTSLPGSIQLSKNGPKSLKGLENIQKVGVNAQGQSVVVTDHNALMTGKGLNLLGSVPGSITFTGNQVLELLYGMDGVQTIGADADGNSLTITHNQMLNNLTALRMCTDVEGAIVLEKNPVLSILNGLQKLTKLSGKNLLGDSLLVWGNPELQNLNEFANLHGSISGAISIQDNAKLNTIIGLSNIKSTGVNTYGNSVFLAQNPVLKEVDGLKGLTGKLTGAIVVKGNNALENLDGLTGVTAIKGKNVAGDSVYIVGNPKLASIDGLSNLGGKMAGGVVVKKNPSLSSITAMLEGTNALTSATSVEVDQVRCLSQKDVTDLKGLCLNYACKAKIQKVTKCAALSVGSHVLVGAGKGRVCGGVSGTDWKAWARYGSSGLYLDVDTTACNFDITPAYVSSVVGDSAHWQLVGVNSIYSASTTGFRIYVWHPVLRGSFMEFFAKKYKWQINWVADTGKTGGLTTPGNTNWKQYAKDTLYVDVDTSLCGYKKTPAYVTSIHGSSDHWRTTGVHNVYYPTQKGFRIYVVHASKTMLAATAEQEKWSISWIGSTDEKYSGHGTNQWHTFCASTDNKCSTTKHYTALYTDVDTSKALLQAPKYVTSVGGEAHHLFATGGASIYRSSAKGFRVYLDKAPTPAVAKAAKWTVNWVAYEKPVDCTTTIWSIYGGCTKECGTGKQTRTRKQLSPANAFGSCPKLSETRDCNKHPCAIHCEVGKWEAFSQCDVSCGFGKQSRQRKILTKTRHGGENCPQTIETQKCNAGPCPVHCEVGTWSVWHACSKQCGVGTKKRERQVLRKPTTDGTVCPALEEEAECIDKQCAVPCQVGDWTIYGECSVTCHVGKQTRTRTVVSTAKYNGRPCPVLVESIPCKRGPCPVHCYVSAWSIYTACSKTCGDGTTTRTRTILRHPKHNGYVCPALRETIPCKAKECPINCRVAQWGKWTKCTKSCGKGTKGRSRKIIRQPTFGGMACPITENEDFCNGQACPENCQVTNFESWGECSQSCCAGNTKCGHMNRNRVVIDVARFGGVVCPKLHQQIPCGLGPCPVHCVVGPYGAFSPCDKTCGGGKQSRARHVIQRRRHQGDVCPSLIDARSCNDWECPQNCQEGSWGAWGLEKEYKGRMVRRRPILIPQANGGIHCPPLIEHKDHQGFICEEHEVFGKWSQCTKNCGFGYQYRYKEHITCADEAVVKYHMRMRQGRHCNRQPCKNAAAYNKPARKVVVPKIDKADMKIKK